MILLSLETMGRSLPLALFEQEADARAFAQKIPGVKEAEWGDFFFSPSALAPYQTIEFEGMLVPLNRCMFTDDDDVWVAIQEVPVLNGAQKGLVPGMQAVDAYVISHDQLEAYVAARENKADMARRLLHQQGLQVHRGGLGSEDGEYLTYSRDGDPLRHFLTHLDPNFVFDTPDGEAAFAVWLKEQMQG